MKREESLVGLLFTFPVLFGFLVFKLIPFIQVVLISLWDSSIFNTASYIGLTNYIYLGSDPFFTASIKATLMYACVQIPLNTLISFYVAMLINKQKKARTLLLVSILIPSIVPTIVNSMVWSYILNPNYGIANELLLWIGLPAQQWFYAPASVLPTMLFMGIWQNSLITLSFYSALQQIPVSLFDALKIEYSGNYKQITQVILPSIFPTLVLAFQFQTIMSFQIFIPAYTITQGGPNKASYFLTYHIYNSAFKYGNFGYACALSVVLCVTIVFFLALNKLIEWRLDRVWKN